jgi:hypothetical protein
MWHEKYQLCDMVSRPLLHGFEGKKGIVQLVNGRLCAGTTMGLRLGTLGQFLRGVKILRQEQHLGIMRCACLRKSSANQLVAALEGNSAVPLRAVFLNTPASFGYLPNAVDDAIY